ncbi:DUF72 domain-containing protein [Alsobacter soli]|uniref:DUF72 domain-containing protein n=2 Tax=Alsobacter soli TaxID=2109933 RepID=A0A2T1HLX1_9HYPH|nr:DUF72 domain-containing protein [Alsobacter soli]
MAARPNTGQIRIGTSGWHYDSWWGPFFPAGLRKSDALSFYVGQFAAVELNAPFYRTPTPEAVRGWREHTPETFRFAWKASRFITHFKRLSERCDSSLALMGTRTELLGDKLGPVLFQLPPRMSKDCGLLERFLGMLDPGLSAAFEFRDPSWYDEETYAVLRARNAALCLSDHAAAPAPIVATASFVYIRLHGTSGRYAGSYSDEALAAWAARIADWSSEGRDVWCFFDNDVKSAAPLDARRLISFCAADQTTRSGLIAPVAGAVSAATSAPGR